MSSTVDRDFYVLALNSGSSSLKFGLYRVQRARIDCVLTGEAESIGGETSGFHAEDSAQRNVLNETAPIADQKVAVARIASLLAERGAPSPQAIGHRIVHGGPTLREHCIIDPPVMQQLAAAIAYAPLHIPAALAVIAFASEHFRGLPQVACIDTSFHATMPRVASTLALPAELRKAGLRRYGFHGLSCESIVRQLPDPLPSRLIIAHLGNGASITAVRDGKSIDTSMGLTPTA